MTVYTVGSVSPVGWSIKPPKSLRRSLNSVKKTISEIRKSKVGKAFDVIYPIKKIREATKKASDFINENKEVIGVVAMIAPPPVNAAAAAALIASQTMSKAEKITNPVISKINTLQRMEVAKKTLPVAKYKPDTLKRYVIKKIKNDIKNTSNPTELNNLQKKLNIAEKIDVSVYEAIQTPGVLLKSEVSLMEEYKNKKENECKCNNNNFGEMPPGGFQ